MARLALGRTVRLRYAYCVTAVEVTARDAAGAPLAIRAVVHPETRGGGHPADGSKVTGVIHWVDAATSVPAEVRLYERLFRVARPEEGGADFLAALDPASLEVVAGARVEASLAAAAVGARWQLERVGYFVVDPDARPGALVLNRIVSLRDSYHEARERPAAGAEPSAAEGPGDDRGAPGARRVSEKAKTRPRSKSPQEYRAEARARDPELAAAHAAIAAQVGPDAADLLSGDRSTAQLFLDTVARAGHADLTAKWMVNELRGALAGRELAASGLDAARLAELITAIASGALPTPAAKAALAELIATGKPLGELAAARPAAPISADDLAAAVAAVLAAHPEKLAQYRAGKAGLRGFFVGQVVKAAPGADPKAAHEALRVALGEPE
jgi:glutaminyl-tRNA synthetase